MRQQLQNESNRNYDIVKQLKDESDQLKKEIDLKDIELNEKNNKITL